MIDQKQTNQSCIHVVGGGLAGSECALKLLILVTKLSLLKCAAKSQQRFTKLP